MLNDGLKKVAQTVQQLFGEDAVEILYDEDTSGELVEAQLRINLPHEIVSRRGKIAGIRIKNFFLRVVSIPP